MPKLSTARGDLWFADHRHGHTLPLLLIHGAGGSHLDWPIGLRRLNSIALDLSGHGKSPGSGHTTIEDYAADVIALMDALSMSTAVIGGHSMGGAIALTLGLHYPERVTALLLIGTGAKLSVHPNILERVIDHQAEVGILFKTWMWGRDADPKLIELGFQQFMKSDPQVIYGDYLACNRFDLRDRLSEIRAPTLVIGGTEDRMTPLKYSEYLAQHLPNAALWTVTGGHMMGLEQSEAVVSRVQNWLTIDI
ncbi:MAG: alpha/beta hydrolase [Anaerolineae bacterium]|jgi:pimeloyl-ACP methyl ester carboxylesterase|nr:alpha/beta hydrolase [Anaerolineae bacterium]